jgi:hypothetical protein
MNGKTNIKDIIIFANQPNIPIYIKRLKTKREHTVQTMTILGGFFSVLSSLRAILVNQDFLNKDEELLELIYNETHIVLHHKQHYKQKTHILIVFLYKQATDDDRELIKKINNRFTELFSKILENWNREITVFKKFDQECESIIDEFIKK